MNPVDLTGMIRVFEYVGNGHYLPKRVGLSLFDLCHRPVNKIERSDIYIRVETMMKPLCILSSERLLNQLISDGKWDGSGAVTLQQIAPLIVTRWKSSLLGLSLIEWPIIDLLNQNVNHVNKIATILFYMSSIISGSSLQETQRHTPEELAGTLRKLSMESIQTIPVSKIPEMGLTLDEIETYKALQMCN